MSTQSETVTTDFEEVSSTKSWIVVLTAALFLLYEFIQMNMISSLNQHLMATFNVQATKLGILTSYYFMANVIFLLPAGQLLDKFSTRKVILFSMAICVIGTFFFSSATTLLSASLFRFMTGIGSAFCFLSCIRLASRWFPAKRMALVSGLIVTMAMIGGWIAQTPFTALVELTGWRQAIRIDAFVGIGIMIFIFLLVRDYPANHIPDAHENYLLSKLTYWRRLKQSYFKKQNIFCGIYTSLMNLPIFLMGAAWGSLYLEQIHHFTPKQATMITGMIFFGTVIGSPLAGFISDSLGKRKKPMLIGSILYLILILLMIYVPDINMPLYMVLFFLLGLITSSQVISYPMVTESNPIALTATSVSVISFITIGGGGVFFIPFFGWLMDLGPKEMINHVPMYSHTSFYSAMLIMPITAVIAFIVAALTRETNCKRFDR